MIMQPTIRGPSKSDDRVKSLGDNPWAKGNLTIKPTCSCKAAIDHGAKCFEKVRNETLTASGGFWEGFQRMSIICA